MPNWFNVKVKHKWVEVPNHLLYQLELLRSQRKKVFVPDERSGLNII